jgi:branched-chain amino acid transport system permease protein
MMNQIVQGILLGGYYALIACGLSFMFSVMRIINLAHGSLAVAAAYLMFMLSERAHLPLWACFVIAVAVMATAGWLIQRLILDRSARGGQLLPILSTFGLSMVIDNSLFEQFGADTRSLANSIGDLSWDSWELPDGMYVGKLPVLIFAVAVLLLAGLQLMLTHTRLGRSIRATAEDPDTTPPPPRSRL